MAGTLIIKGGVSLKGLQREALAALDECVTVFSNRGYETVLTSARGDRHGAYSHHYKGLAFDLRSKHLRADEKQEVLAAMQTAIGPDYQCFLESLGAPYEHYHVEYDPQHVVSYPDI
jgi:hypothetical protein